jgi:quercetin dioxygenase-like cupin family protein
MHPELRLIEDFLTDKGAISLPAMPRMLFVVRGAVTIGQRVLGQGEALFGEDLITAHAEGTGATLWRWELSDPRLPAVKTTGSSVSSWDKLAVPLATLPEGELLWRGDSVAFPPGGCAYLHRHQGPGIRCLIEGSLRVDTAGQSHAYEIGDAWFESGPDPVFAQAGERATRFIRVMILPRALIGKSSIQYVNDEDREKPKTQQYRVFVDTPLTRPV